MNISKLQLLEGARNAKGLTIVIDVFRAFSVECYLMHNGAARIYPVASVEQAYSLKKKHPDYVLIGERHEKICEGFDFGNSPSHILNTDFSGKTIIHTTSSGTQGIDLATKASEILTGSFVNASAIVRYIQNSGLEHVSLVSMGYEGKYTTDEDEFCALYIENELCGKESNLGEMVEILKHGDGARLLDPKNHEHSPASDFNLCLDFNRFNFVLRIVKDQNGLNYLEKLDC
ncbi:MAG: 2-phosphosulfolactate phosphatase [Prolixibacteraceae bacterium]